MSVDGESLLLVLAEIGLGLAGFSAVVIALRRDPKKAWRPAEVAGIKLILEFSFAMVFFSLLPSVLSHWFVSDRTLWSISSLLVSVFLGYEILLNLRRLKRIQKQKDRPFSKTGVIFGIVVPTTVFLFLELYASLKSLSALFILGLLYLLASSVIQFYIFLVRYTQPAS